MLEGLLRFEQELAARSESGLIQVYGRASVHGRDVESPARISGPFVSCNKSRGNLLQRRDFDRCLPSRHASLQLRPFDFPAADLKPQLPSNAGQIRRAR
jgi:hypothetical protein